MSAGQGIGSFMSGMASGYSIGDSLSRQAELDKRLKALEATLPAASADTTPLSPSGPTTPSASAAATPAATGGQQTPRSPMKMVDPVASDLAPHQRAFLNAISDGESGGKYNVRYTPKGGAEFSDLSKHPGIMEKGPDGPSSAAGRYQFTKTTWNGMGGGDFSPENQDRRAWQLAVSDYNKQTGRNLDADLQKGGLSNNILSALSPTWTSFRNNTAKHIGAYNDSLSRYSQTTPKSIASASTPKKKADDAIGIIDELMPQPRSIIQ